MRRVTDFILFRQLILGVSCATVFAGSAAAMGQTSSIGARQRADTANGTEPASAEPSTRVKAHEVQQRYAWIAVKPNEARKHKVHDLITIVVRQRNQYEADAQLRTKKEWDIKTELDAFINATAGGIGASVFRRGNPNIDFKFDNELKGRADLDREDRFTTRITAEVVDVKPNGNLVLEGRGRITFDEEDSRITITGVCRKDDVGPDNTVLSTQLADLAIHVDNDGALRANTTRGWITKLLDWLKPI